MGNTTDSIITAPLTSPRQTVPPAFTNSAAWVLPPAMLTARPVVKTAPVKTAPVETDTGPNATRQLPSWLKSATVPQTLAAAVAVIIAADLGFLMRRPHMSLASAAIMPVSIVAPPLAEPDPHPVTTTTTTSPPSLI